MICWAMDLVRNGRSKIRLREPQALTIVTGADREAIDATYDTGNRLMHLIVHTRQRSLAERTAVFPRRR